MTDAEINRALREAIGLERFRKWSRDRRAVLARDGLCINGATHGPATHGKKCAWCAAVHKLGLSVVLELAARGEAPPRPPGHVVRPRERSHLPDRSGARLPD